MTTKEKIDEVGNVASRDEELAEDYETSQQLARLSGYIFMGNLVDVQIGFKSRSGICRLWGELGAESKILGFCLI